MQTALNIKNTQSVTLRKEKTLCLLLGLVVYFVSCVTEKILSLISVNVAESRSFTAVKSETDKDTVVAKLCAVAVAFTTASVVYFTMLFLVGQGYRDGIAAEFIVSSVIYVIVYKVISFFTSVE